MFERFTEDARRVIFYSRSEAIAAGSPYIETEHLLLGILREDNDILRRFLTPHSDADQLRGSIAHATAFHGPSSTSGDLPLTHESKRILAYSAEEADRLGHKSIGVEHLILGTLREEGSLAARLLCQTGLKLKTARAKTAEIIKEALLTKGAVSTAQTAHAAADGPEPEHNGIRPAVALTQISETEFLLTQPVNSHGPRIGEAIFLHGNQASARSYRVTDVIWEFDYEAERHTLAQLRLKVKSDATGPA